MPSLNVPQAQFLAMPQKFKAYVAGFGSGKTWVGSGGILKHFGEHPRVNAGYFAPTYKLVKGVFYPTIEEVAYDWGFQTNIKVSDHEVHISRGRKHYGVIHCRTMDNPQNIVGFKIGHGLVDELDIMTADKAREAWRKIIARMRYKVPGLRNGLDVTTTPEGFRFTYEQFKKNKSLMYGLLQASTYDNAKNLPDDYISSLLESYPDSLIEAYLNGEFVNLTSGTIYNQYSKENRSFEKVTEDDKVLSIGMDFNVTKMAARVFVYRDKSPHCVDEFNELYDTADMIEHIIMRYPEKKIIVYPDASGKNRKSNGADETDIKLLKKAGFRVKAKDANPRVKTRINSVNAMFCNAKGERRLFVNKDTCPVTHDELEQQVYNDKGEPDKSAGKDHGNDAFGYFIAYEHGIKPKSSHFKIHG